MPSLLIMLAALLALTPTARSQVGTVVAWGSNPDGQTDVPLGLTDVVQVAAGFSHAVAVKADGTVVAWGLNDFGQASVPAGLTGVVQVAAGYWHTVALKADGTVVSWGSQTFVPPGLTGVVQIAAGNNSRHTVALKSDGTVVSWGSNEAGQASVPAGLTGVVQVAAGYAHTLAVKADGSIAAWGSTLYGEGSDPYELTDAVQVAAGSGYSVALKADGTVLAWGYNAQHQTNVPAGLTGVVQVAAGSYHTLALKADGTVVAWSGGGATAVPPGLTGVAQVAAGYDLSVALVGEPPQPSEVPSAGLQLWLRADAGVTADASGRVSTWADQSPSGSDAVQSNLGQQPLLVPNAIGTQPALRFDGANDFLSLGDVLDDVFAGPDQQSTLFFVVKANPSPQNGLLSKYETNNARAYSFRTYPEVPSVITTFTTDGSAYRGYGGSTNVIGRPSLLTFTYDGTVPGEDRYGIGVDGTPEAVQFQFGAGPMGDIQDTAIPTLVGAAGQNFGVPAALLNGDLSEILVYDRLLANTEREEVEDYLCEKYGLAACASVIVNNAPAAAADSYDPIEDAPLVVAAPGVLGTTPTSDGDALYGGHRERRLERHPHAQRQRLLRLYARG